MSLFVTLAADILVAVLLAATIVTSLRLSRRISQLKGKLFGKGPQYRVAGTPQFQFIFLQE